jgi:DNA-binding NtrC family response regulator
MSLSLLFVEQGDYFRAALGSRLSRKEYCFYFANRYGDATSILSRKPIDVGLVDLSSLKMEGVRIIEEIKSLKPRVEIITINTYDHLVHSIEAMKAGVFDDFLIPVEINALISRIQAAGLEKKKKERQRRPFLQKCQDAMMAVAFAEAGELETARIIAETGKVSDQPKETKHGQGKG